MTPSDIRKPLQAPRIQIKDLSHDFEGRSVLKNLSLEVRRGEFLVLLGPSGCGKSTLLRLIAGLITPTEGEALSDCPPDRVGFVFQDACLIPWRTALENVSLPLEILGTPKPQARMEAESLLQDVGLGAHLHHYPDALSGGMRMRVSIARSLAGDPRLLLLDEPFAALDEFKRRNLDAYLSNLSLNRPITTVMVTHSIEEALLLADRVVVMAPYGGGILLNESIEEKRGRSPQCLYETPFRALSERLSVALEPRE